MFGKQFGDGFKGGAALAQFGNHIFCREQFLKLDRTLRDEFGNRLAGDNRIKGRHRMEMPGSRFGKHLAAGAESSAKFTGRSLSKTVASPGRWRIHDGRLFRKMFCTWRKLDWDWNVKSSGAWNECGLGMIVGMGSS